SPELARAILKSLEKDKDKRYADADAFALALTATPEAGGKPEKSPAPWLAQRWGRPIWQWGAAALAVVMLVGVLLAMVLSVSSSNAAAPAHAPQVAVPAPAPSSGPISPGALRHLQLAASYQKRLWCSDSLDELDRALRDDAR